ncbi:GMC oxidoreductase, partial [Rhizobium ruizarguesonis]
GYKLSKSRGSVSLRSADPKADTVLRFNYMSHAEDWEKFRIGSSNVYRNS